MDVGYTYGSAEGVRLCVYVPRGFTPPARVTAEHGDRFVDFVRVSDQSFDCGYARGVKGVCKSYECHRSLLGKCQCGRHPDGVRLRVAVDG